jgi:hypothetical protein
VSSEIGKGSAFCFVIDLPIKEYDEESKYEDAKEEQLLID